MYEAERDTNRRPTHPGAILADVIEDIGITKKGAAERLGISRQHLYDICNEVKPISKDVAGRIGKAMGNGAGVWLRMQANLDAWEADRMTTIDDVQLLAG